jgi:hypothetical protein
VPSDARGQYAIQITFDMGPLAGKISGKKKFEVNE